MMQLTQALLPALSLLLTPAHAANHYADPVFLAKDALDTATVLAPPPARGSAGDLADFEIILGYQRARTAQECRRAAFVVDVRLATLFGPDYGPLTAREAEQWAPFFEKVRVDTDYFVQETKKFWARPRPFITDARVEPCVHREVTMAYPSGHASIARVFAVVLAELAPERAAAFAARAEEIAEDRVRAGVHHPSDIEAGKRLGDQVLQQLMQTQTFKTELKTLKRQRNASSSKPVYSSPIFLTI